MIYSSVLLKHSSSLENGISTFSNFNFFPYAYLSSLTFKKICFWLGLTSFNYTVKKLLKLKYIQNKLITSAFLPSAHFFIVVLSKVNELYQRKGFPVLPHYT